MCNNVPLNQLDRTHMQESTPIDSIAVISRLLDFVEGVQLLDYNEIIMSNHCSCLMDITAAHVP